MTPKRKYWEYIIPTSNKCNDLIYEEVVQIVQNFNPIQLASDYSYPSVIFQVLKRPLPKHRVNLNLIN